jgi:diguanylate cyclase (GGDEF)-like protein
MLRDVPAATLHRRLLVATAAVAYGVIFVAFMLFEVPGLGLGHFFYIPVALLALACGARVGFAAGILATGLYTIAILATNLPARDVLTSASGIRLVTYCASGVLIGRFATSNRALVDQLRELAERDFLTGLRNARVFDDALARRCAEGRPFVLLLGDMDNLKEINDTHGHAEGNRALRRLADALHQNVGPGDDLARVGGDEFAILTSASFHEAIALADRLRHALALERLEISFGWSGSPDDAVTPVELFRKADDRLYAAKLVARNRRTVVALAGSGRS